MTYHKKFAAERLYYYNTRQLESEVMQITLPAGNPQPTIFVSDEGFFCAYLLHRKYPSLQIDRNNCNFKSQDFCIIEENEHPYWLEQYTLIEKRAAFLVYARKRKQL